MRYIIQAHKKFVYFCVFVNMTHHHLFYFIYDYSLSCTLGLCSVPLGSSAGPDAAGV